MEPTRDLEVRESEIEDVFAHYPQLLKESLKVTDEIYLLARQKLLRSGRLDLVYGCGSELFLVELKVEDFKRKFLDQVLGYQRDLTELQSQGQFLRGNVVPICIARLQRQRTRVCYEPRRETLRVRSERDSFTILPKRAARH